MKLSELNTDERLALMGLLKMVIQADQEVTPEEVEQLNRLAEDMGAELWRASRSEAARRFPTLNEVRLFVPTIENQQARELIFQVIKDMAGAERIVPLEQSVLNWLARVWNIRS